MGRGDGGQDTGGDGPGRPAHAGRAQPLERRQGPVVGAVTNRTGVRGEVRPHAGRSVPPCRDVPALARRQARDRMHLRAARSYSGLRACRGFRCISRYAATCSGVASDQGFGIGGRSGCFGRSSSGTCCRLMRMRHQVDERPRIESVRTSAGCRCSTTAACSSFHFSNDSSASSFFVECVMTINGCFETRLPVPVVFGFFFLRDGCTRAGSPGIFLYCGGHGASPCPSCSCFAESASSCSSEPGCRSISAWRSPLALNHAGMVLIVKSAGSHLSISSHVSGVETRASGRGRTENAEHTVRSFAFWL